MSDDKKTEVDEVTDNVKKFERAAPTHLWIPVETVNRVLTNLGNQKLIDVIDIFNELRNFAEASFKEQMDKK